MPNNTTEANTFEKSFTKFLTKDLSKINIADDLLKKGYWVTYEDNKGRLIKEYPNGKKLLVKFDKENNTFHETEITN